MMNKLTIDSTALKTALAKLAVVVTNKHTLPVLSYVYCRAAGNILEMTGTNTELTITYTAECVCEGDFNFLLPFEFTNKIVAVLKNALLEIRAGKKIKILADGDAYELNVSCNIADFPSMPGLPDNSFKIYGPVLQSLDTALATIAKGGYRNPALTKVLLAFKAGKATVASTDGAYVVYTNEIECEGNEHEEFLIDPKIIKALDTGAEISACYNEKFIAFIADNLTIIYTRSEEKFADFRRIFPEEWPGNLIINRYDLISALVKCSLANDNLHTTTLDFSAEGKMRLLADDSIIKIDLTVDCNYTGTVNKVSIDSARLMVLLGQIESTEVELALHNEKRAIVITCQGEPGYKGLIMPKANA